MHLFFTIALIFLGQILFQKTLEFLFLPISAVEMAGIAIIGLSLGSLLPFRLSKKAGWLAFTCHLLFIASIYFKITELILTSVALIFFGLGGLANFFLIRKPTYQNYLFDLAGGLVGLLAGYFLLPLLGGEVLLLLFPFFIASLQLAIQTNFNRRQFRLALLISVTFWATLPYLSAEFNLVDFGRPLPNPLPSESSEPINLSLGIRNKSLKLISTHWSMMTRVDLGEDQLGKRALFFNNHNWSVVHSPKVISAPNPAIAEANGPILIVGVGGGNEIALSHRLHPDAEVTGFEIVPEVVKLMNSPEVESHTEMSYREVHLFDGRFAAKIVPTNHYSLVYLAKPGLHFGSFGPFLDNDDRLVAKESLDKLLDLLRADGVMATAAYWYFDGRTRVPELLATIRRLLIDRNLEFNQNLVAFRSPRDETRQRFQYNFLISKKPIGPEYLRQLTNSIEKSDGQVIFPQNAISKLNKTDIGVWSLINSQVKTRHVTVNQPFWGNFAELRANIAAILNRSLPILLSTLAIGLLAIRYRKPIHLADHQSVLILLSSFVAGTAYAFLMVQLFRWTSDISPLPHRTVLLVNSGLLVGSALSNMFWSKWFSDEFTSRWRCRVRQWLLAGCTVLASLVFILPMADTTTSGADTISLISFLCSSIAGFAVGIGFPTLMRLSQSKPVLNYILASNGFGFALGIVGCKILVLAYGYGSLPALSLSAFLLFSILLSVLTTRAGRQ